MSTVRDILGVHAAPTVTSPMASVMSSIGMGKTTPNQKKRKSFASRMESKLVASLRDSMNPVLAGSPTKPSLNRHWGMVEFGNSAHPGNLRLRHWDYEQERQSYAGAKFDVSVHIPELHALPQAEKAQLVCKFKLKDEHDLSYIFDLVGRFELRFLVVADYLKSSGPAPLSTLTVEDLKEMYYSVYSLIWASKKCRFSIDLERERRESLQERFSLIAVEGADNVESKKKEEKRIQGEIKEMEQKMKQIESDQGLLESMILTMSNQAASEDTHGLVGLFTRSCVPGCSSKEAKPVSSGVILSLKPRINFASCPVPPVCSRFSSLRIESFLKTLGQLADQEKQLVGFIKKKEGEVKALQKSLAKS